MAKLTLKPDQKVLAAYFEINVSLRRQIENDYGTDELATMKFSIPVGTLDANRSTVADALWSLQRTFEAAYGAVIPAAIPVVGKNDAEFEPPLHVDAPVEEVPF